MLTDPTKAEVFMKEWVVRPGIQVSTDGSGVAGLARISWHRVSETGMGATSPSEGPVSGRTCEHISFSTLKRPC